MNDYDIWLVIALLGVGTFVIRFSFLGLVGRKPMPPMVLRHLRYAAVAVLPGLVMPLVVWPPASGGEPDQVRIAAACMTLLAGYLTRSVIWGMGAGALTLYGLLGLGVLFG